MAEGRGPHHPPAIRHLPSAIRNGVSLEPRENRTRPFPSLLLLAAPTSLHADDPMCATSEGNDARVRALHERTLARPRIAANATTSAPAVRDGAFYLGVDDRTPPGYRPFDLEGQSLVFEPRPSGYAVRREALHWYEPMTAPLRDFSTATGTSWFYVQYDVSGTPPMLFGQPATTLYRRPSNAIHPAPPAEPPATQFDALDAPVYPQPLLSPLMITSRK